MPADWDLPLDPHTPVLATGYVASDELPVLQVVHEHDGDWQFLDDVHDPEIEHAAWLCMHHLVEADPTLREAVAALRRGQRARRGDVGDQWSVEAYEDEPDV